MGRLRVMALWLACKELCFGCLIAKAIWVNFFWHRDVCAAGLENVNEMR